MSTARYLGEHYDMESPFSFDVSKALRYGRPNELAVWMTSEQTVKDCSSNCDYDFNRTGIWQWSGCGSIPRSASTTFRDDLGPQEGDHGAGDSGQRHGRFTAGCPRLRSSRLVLGRRRKPPQPPVVLRLSGETVELAAGETKVVDLKAKWEHPRLWSPDNPYLYVMTTTAASAGGTQDIRHDRFGFREFWIEGTSFVLNGVKVFLPEIWGDLYEQPVGDLNNEKTWGPLCDCKPAFLAAKASGFRAVRLWWAGEGQRLARRRTTPTKPA